MSTEMGINSQKYERQGLEAERTERIQGETRGNNKASDEDEWIEVEPER